MGDHLPARTRVRIAEREVYLYLQAECTDCIHDHACCDFVGFCILRVLLFTANPADEANADAFLFGFHSTPWPKTRPDQRLVFFRSVSGNGLPFGGIIDRIC